jgi:hypothetical protein
MRFMMLVKSAETSPAGPPPARLLQAIGELGAEASKAGALIATGGLAPSATGARVRVSGGSLAVNNGPFTEPKELVGAYAIYELKSKEEAIDWASRFLQLYLDHWKGWEGETEVRQVFG